MSTESRKTYEPLANMLKSLSHPARLAILDIIDEEEVVCVCDLEKRLGYRQAYLSQHLMCLRKKGLVSSYRDGKHVYYCIEEKGLIHIIHDLKKMISSGSIKFDASNCKAIKHDHNIIEINKIQNH